jgi:hypothetical protein
LTTRPGEIAEAQALIVGDWLVVTDPTDGNVSRYGCEGTLLFLSTGEIHDNRPARQRGQWQIKWIDDEIVGVGLALTMAWEVPDVEQESLEALTGQIGAWSYTHEHCFIEFIDDNTVLLTGLLGGPKTLLKRQ